MRSEIEKNLYFLGVRTIQNYRYGYKEFLDYNEAA